MDFTKLPNQNPEIKFVGFIIYVVRLLKEDAMFPYYVQTFIHSASVGFHVKSSGQTFIKHFVQQANEMIKNGQKTKTKSSTWKLIKLLLIFPLPSGEFVAV